MKSLSTLELLKNTIQPLRKESDVLATGTDVKVSTGSSQHAGKAQEHSLIEDKESEKLAVEMGVDVSTKISKCAGPDMERKAQQFQQCKDKPFLS